MFLFAKLDELNHTYETEQQLDGSFKIVIQKNGS